MQFIVDSDDDVAIAAGDFIIFVITRVWPFTVYIAYDAFAHHVAGYGSSRADVYFTPYGTLPQLQYDGEIHIKRSSSIVVLCGVDLSRTLSQLQAIGGCRWLSVPSQYQSVIGDYLHQLMDY